MKQLNKIETIKLLQRGNSLIQKKYPDFGIKNLFKPIKKFNKFTSKFFIDDISVNTKSGYSIIRSNVKCVKIERQGLVEIIEWSLK